MKYLLCGNGVNLQFDEENYSRAALVLRVLKNCDREDFPTNIITTEPFKLKTYLGYLFLEARKIIHDEYDAFATCTAERLALTDFKDHYASNLASLRMVDIGFEDYYLIHDLLCHKLGIGNPNQYYIREAMRIAYLYAIYNDGKLNKNYEHFTDNFKTYINGFDVIFTSNYDTNIEQVTDRPVYHLHGQFDKLDDVYDASSLRNHLPDAPIRETTIDTNYSYLYSNVLSTHSGAYKEFQMKQQSQANVALEKMLIQYNSDPAFQKVVQDWVSDTNRITSNLGSAIIEKSKNPSLKFTDHYHFKDFQEMKGTLEILGISPWNDLHIFEAIENSEVSSCVYYYHSESAVSEIKRLLPEMEKSKKLVFRSVEDFWRNH